MRDLISACCKMLQIPDQPYDLFEQQKMIAFSIRSVSVNYRCSLLETGDLQYHLEVVGQARDPATLLPVGSLIFTGDLQMILGTLTFKDCPVIDYLGYETS